jgi:nucleoside-diphosphate-sugar epimerase
MLEKVGKLRRSAFLFAWSYLVATAAGIQICKRHVPGPQGVRGRNSDNTRLREVLPWEPQISLEEGLRRTYRWIEEQVREKLEAKAIRTEEVFA